MFLLFILLLLLSFFLSIIFYLFSYFLEQARRQVVVLEGYLVPVSTVLVTPDLRGANQSIGPGERGRYSGVLQHRTSVLTNLSCCCWRTRTTSRRSQSRWTSPRRRSQRRRSQRRRKKTRRTNRRTPRPASGS